MGIPLSEILDDDVASMREQASVNNLPYVPFTMRELITPQYQVDFSDSWVSSPSQAQVDSSDETWENWVGQHEDEYEELRPTNRKQLVAAVVYKAHNGERVRAVGSGHSHSDAPAPAGTYIELNPGDPPDELSDRHDTPTKDGLNDILDHEGWLKADDELKAIERRERDAQPTSGGGDPDGFYNPLTGTRLQQPAGKQYLKRVQAGLMLRRLNRHVLREYGDRAFALSNMGSFDGQTIAGAVNTSTHGTGVTLSSISDSVKSVEIATVPRSESGNPIVRLYRIEPSDGITDRDAFEADTGTHEMELIQDDDVFHSVVVGYGCMGVVYGYTLRVVDNYWLREENKLMAWSDVKAEMSNVSWEVTEDSVREFLTKDGTRHCQIFLNTAAEQVPEGRIHDHTSEPGIGPNRDDAHGVGYHEDRRDPLCLVKRHKVTDQPDGTVLSLENTVSKPRDSSGSIDWVNASKDQRWPPERRSKPFRDAGKFFLNFHPFASNNGKAGQLHRRFFHPEFRKDQYVGGMSSSVWYVALRRLRDRIGQLDASEYRHPVPPGPATPTTEIGVSVGDVVEAVDAFRKRVRNVSLPWGTEDEVREEEVFFPAPMGIRFTASSAHYLSPEHDRATAMVELPLPLPGEGKTAGALKPALPALTHDGMRNQVVLPALTAVESHIREEKRNLRPRPHMGKHSTVDFEWLDETYDYFDHYDPSADDDEVETGWYQNYQRFNAFGTFDNKFTEQLGISMSTTVQSGELQGTPQPTGTKTATQSTETGITSPSAETQGPSQPTDDATDASEPDFRATADVDVELPGFGFLAGLAGLGTGAWLYRHQSDDETAGGDTESDSTPGAGDTEPDAENTGVTSGDKGTRDAAENPSDDSTRTER